jgi:hypothetical protein
MVGDGKDISRLQKRVFQLETACRAAAQDLINAQEKLESEQAMFRRLQAASDLTVEIPDAEFEFDENMSGKHVKYRIVVSSESDPTLFVTVRRRYSEFLYLHAKLQTTVDPPKKVSRCLCAFLYNFY